MERHFLPKPLLISFFLFVFSSIAIANDENACIEPSVAEVTGLLPGMNKASLDKVNKYISIETGSGEDDGGYYEKQIYRYSKYDITIVRDIIDSILITSPEYLWAQKIKIGTDRSIVQKHIKPAPVIEDKISSQYVVCSNVGDVYVLFSYLNNKVKQIAVVIDRP